MSSSTRRAAIARLIELGVPFASENGALHLTREGGHSHRRIVHVADATGWAIQQALEAAAAQASEHHAGARHGRDRPDHRPPRDAFLDQRRGPRPLRLQPQEEAGRDADRRGRRSWPRGGAGRAYLYSTAPRGATGDGIAMAWRAGCRISNMEFMQFHPTCLYNLEVKNFLITEAVRGEGGHAEATPVTGHRFMPDYRRARRACAARHRRPRHRP